MDDNRKKLLELMEDLSFPLNPEEAEEKVKGLTDEEVIDLVLVYSDVVNYEDALEEYVDNPDDITQLRFCFTYIHQIYGTLQMVELYGHGGTSLKIFQD